MNKKPKKQGFNLEEIRTQVAQDELKARHWKAQYETAYYHLEFEKILPEYTALLEKKEAEREEFLKQQQEMLDKVNELSKDTGIVIEEANGN